MTASPSIMYILDGVTLPPHPPPPSNETNYGPITPILMKLFCMKIQWGIGYVCLRRKDLAHSTGNWMLNRMLLVLCRCLTYLHWRAMSPLNWLTFVRGYWCIHTLLQGPIPVVNSYDFPLIWFDLELFNYTHIHSTEITQIECIWVKCVTAVYL